MKIPRLVCSIAVVVWFGACAQRTPEASGPSANSTPTTSAPAPLAEATPVEAPASPPPAPAPGLGSEAGKRDSAELDGEFESLEAAERALNQAKADLDRLALAEPQKALGRSAVSDSSAEKKQKPAAKAPSASAAGTAAPNALCENACRAFSSLTRAANAVCRLDGNGGAHCTHAKRVLADSQLRVASCSCPAE